MAHASFVLKSFTQKIEQLLKRRFLALAFCFTAGSLASLSMAPLNAWPILFVSIPALYFSILYAGSNKGAFIRGWLFGFGYFLFSLSWIGNALLVEGNPYKWAWPIAVSGLPALLAFFPAFTALFSKKFLNLRCLWGWLGFISLYCGFEWLRGHVFTGFPWNLFGYTWADNLTILQTLWLSDAYMLTWLTLLWASMPACLLVFNKHHKIFSVGLAGALLVACLLFGSLQLQHEQAHHEDVNIRLVQPNIDQAEKWQGDKMAGHFSKHLELSQNTEQTDTPTFIIWPETALSYRILNSAKAVEDIRSMLRSYNQSSTLLTGMLRFDKEDSSYTNSLIAIERNGNISNIYDKHHLVPFGEYMPFQKWIPLAPIVQFKGFTRGEGLKVMETTAGLKYSPLICYEIIFPGRSVPKHGSTDFIVNVTNDAWYGQSAGPYQHLTQALFRAIETGVPVIRSANTGFSAVISPYGRVAGQTELFSTNAQNHALPQKRNLPEGLKLFKHTFATLFLLVLISAGILTQRQFSKPH